MLVLPVLDQKIESSFLLSGGDLSCVQTDTRIELTVSSRGRIMSPAVIELVLDSVCKGMSTL